MKVSTKEIVEALRGECNGYQRVMLADRIEAEGIDQDDGRTPIAWAVDTESFGRCYSVSDEFMKAFPNFPVPPSKADQMTRCVECGGSGVDPIPYPVCCKRPDGDGGCCGSPEPEWGWCSDCDGSGLVSSYVSPPSIKDLIDDLIKRIDTWTPTVNIDSQWMHEAYNLIVDCRAEIEFLLQANEGLRNQNTSLDEKLAELEAEIERATKALAKANEQAERFEREWYLRGDEIEALRQAQAAPVEPVGTLFFSGPIGHFWVDTLEMGERILHYMKVDDDDWTATNTTPPSIDALIGEIESIPTYTNLYPPFPDNAPPCDKLVQKSLLDKITDKYRGKK